MLVIKRVRRDTLDGRGNLRTSAAVCSMKGSCEVDIRLAQQVEGIIKDFRLGTSEMARTISEIAADGKRILQAGDVKLLVQKLPEAGTREDEAEK